MKPVRATLTFLALAVLAGALNGQIPQIRGLPPLSDEAAYWWARAVGEKARNPSKAILVSRFRFQRLRQFRSWQDLQALRDYVEWADRPEAADFQDNEVVADVSANDLILVRLPAAGVKASVPIYRDPIGYAVLDPGRSGRVRISLTMPAVQGTIPALPADLPLGPVPLINAAVRSGPSIVTLYGEALSGRKVKVYSRRGEGEVLYSSPNQINAKVPSLDRVSVEVDGLRSDWVEVEP